MDNQLHWTNFPPFQSVVLRYECTLNYFMWRCRHIEAWCKQRMQAKWEVTSDTWVYHAPDLDAIGSLFSQTWLSNQHPCKEKGEKKFSIYLNYSLHLQKPFHCNCIKHLSSSKEERSKHHNQQKCVFACKRELKASSITRCCLDCSLSMLTQYIPPYNAK